MPELAVIGAVIAALLWPERDRFGGLVGADPRLILPFARSLAMHMPGAVVAILATVAAADYLFQYRQWARAAQNVAAGAERGVRALHGTVEVDQEIRPEHYRAVAEIIGYIMRLRRAVSAGKTL